MIPGEGVDSASVASALQAHPELITFAVERVEGEAEAVSLASALCALQGSRDVKRQERARRSAAVQAALVSQELVRGGEPAALGIRALALDALGVPDPNLALALEVAPCSELWKLELARWSEGGASQAVAARAQWDRALASGTLSTAPPQAELKRVARALGAEGPLQELRLREGFMEAAKESSRTATTSAAASPTLGERRSRRARPGAPWLRSASTDGSPEDPGASCPRSANSAQG